MLDIIISSKTRIKLLIKFFLIKGSKGYLRGLERELKETSNAVRVELTRFEKYGLLISKFTGRRKVYQANPQHPLYDDITNIVHKTVGIDQLVAEIASKVNDLEEAYVTGDFAMGIDSDTIELALAGKNIDISGIPEMVSKTEQLIHRKIMFLVLTPDQLEYYFKNKPLLLIWKAR